MTATTQAENYLSVMVAMRDELKGAWDKIWGMQI
jgi:flagellar hook-basal body complex protein FliE